MRACAEYTGQQVREKACDLQGPRIFYIQCTLSHLIITMIQAETTEYSSCLVESYSSLFKIRNRKKHSSEESSLTTCPSYLKPYLLNCVLIMTILHEHSLLLPHGFKIIYFAVSPSKTKNSFKAGINTYSCFYPKHLAEYLVIVRKWSPWRFIQGHITNKGIRKQALMSLSLYHGTLSSPISG